MKNASYPIIKMKQGCSKRLKSGSVWGFSNEIDMTPETKNIPKGTLVRLHDSTDTFLGIGFFNPYSLISFRKIANDPQTKIDTDFFIKKFKRCIDLRNGIVNSPFYRMVHSEGDNLAGLIIDRFDDVLACQLNTAGMDCLKNEIVDALDAVLSPSCIVLRAESQARTLEGIDPLYEIAKGELPDIVSVRENGIYFCADLKEGQKTGWFYDQRENRSFVGRLAPNKRCIDFYTYAGGFALHMGIGHAKQVIGVDRSQSAIDLASKAAEINGLSDKCSWIKDNAFDVLENMNKDKEKFGVVVCDPPAFAKVKKDIQAGLRGYRKVARLAAGLVEKDGILALGSCSHHVKPNEFFAECMKGLTQAGKTGRVLLQSGAGADHPVHPHLPETAYLKMIVCQVD